MNHFEHLTCNYSAALFVIKLRASVKSCYIDDLMAVAHRDICHRFSHYILFLIHRNMIKFVESNMRPNVTDQYISEGS